MTVELDTVWGSKMVTGTLGRRERILSEVGDSAAPVETKRSVEMILV